MFKQILYSFFTFLFCANCFAQEGVKPLVTNINYLYGDLKPAKENNTAITPAAKMRSASMPSVPLFFDDFSYAYRYSYPSPALWSDSSTYVNTTFAIAPWSVGVATFDGLNKRGYPYTPALIDMTKSLPADTLTSKPINLAAYSTNTTLALSFYYQARGRGEAPEVTDSLLLDFYIPAQSTWKTVWYQRGNTSPNINDTLFKRGFVKLDSAYYRQSGFKFRFRNKATTAGNYDHWHLDYVLLNDDRDSLADTLSNDFSFGYIPTPLLKNYAAMPWKHYDTSDMRTRNSVFVRNNGVDQGQVTYVNRIFDNNDVLVKNNFYGNTNVPGFFKDSGWVKTTTLSNPQLKYKVPLLTGPADYKIRHVIFQDSTAPAGEFVTANDTVLQHQTFSNFFAFDDGSAEGGYYINGVGGKIAAKYKLKVSDTLRSVRIYFDQVGTFNSSPYKFRIYVWLPGTNGPSNAVLYKDSVRTPNYFPNNAINISWSEYFLSTPLILNTGTYYIGIRQEVAAGVVVGFDKNLDHSSSLYYDSGNGWTQSAIYGSIMIRPVFGSYFPVGINEKQEEEKTNTFSVYPNPASDRVTIYTEKFEKANYTLVNSIGQIISEGKIENAEHTLQTDNLSNGLYFLILKINGKPVQQNKIIIQH